MAALIVICFLFALLGGVLGYFSLRFKADADTLVNKIDSLLPQIQCGQCKYPGCRPYAEAIANNEADINQCPPGGDELIGSLANLLGVEANFSGAELGRKKSNHIAIIDETKCIGCTLCIQACPVDAIVGAPKFMHTVIASECTGCDLCLPPCPVDCISLQILP
jgi:electron transport complex protein RnfB